MYLACLIPAQQTPRRSPIVGTMSGQRRRRWPNIVPALGERLVFVELSPYIFFPTSLSQSSIHSTYQVDIAGSLRDREVACSASDRQGTNFEFPILCLEDSVISIISPSSGGSPGPV